MTRINVINADHNNEAKELLDAVQANLGITPNKLKRLHNRRPRARTETLRKNVVRS